MKMSTLELLNKIAPNNVKRSRVETVRDMYLDYRLTMIQKRAIESFIFEPTEEQALKAMEITPKAWFFIRHVVSDEKIVANVCEGIKQGYVNNMYIRTIVSNNGLKDLRMLLLQSQCKYEVGKYMKKILLEKKLKR
ncbi:hypothetical protein P9D39_16230 [Heyndrickxia oleronia]|uniref:Uncharacterized protein n=2 Tax=Heyndrickxia oleronia TaxID=38875 RepID=A0A8E2I6Q3_9BACI|nr:hypothetical protein [Heyndrickxia oleronia]MEC1375839.1 hypothetical protein [Heyndrickxia oleronia]OOP67746.1 hypothetical protein BWZ43_14185 [Heyndrickxia oleronia]QQZ05557.1 hypothetical protein I5818_03410 [Heyndrickxia oleronia]